MGFNHCEECGRPWINGTQIHEFGCSFKPKFVDEPVSATHEEPLGPYHERHEAIWHYVDGPNGTCFSSRNEDDNRAMCGVFNREFQSRLLASGKAEERVKTLEAQVELITKNAKGHMKLAEELEAEVSRLRGALEYYADPKNWEYTDCGGQYSWNCTIKDDIYLNPEVGEGGGIDYAGRRAKEALNPPSEREGK